jgi:hypothetical protein
MEHAVLMMIQTVEQAETVFRGYATVEDVQPMMNVQELHHIVI